MLENVSQETLYNTAAAEVVDTVLSGFSGCVFAYGQVRGALLLRLARKICPEGAMSGELRARHLGGAVSPHAVPTTA